MTRLLVMGRGFYPNNAYFFGVRFNHPQTVVFENNLGTNPTAKHDLDLETTYFFALTKDKQFELLADFLKQANIEVPTGNVAADPSNSDQVGF